MILYDFKYRGPYEYDKFILNYMQIHNEVHRVKRKSFPEEKVANGALKEEADAIHEIFRETILEKDPADDFYLISLQFM